jgi:hypothetical protein
MYEGFESIYDNSLELLENEFEEKNQQTRSIAKVFQEALKEIPLWNQDIIDHECYRIIQVSNCDYLEDLIEAVFIAESKILTAVQSIKGKTKVHVPRASHFIHRSYIAAAREIYKNPYVFNHSRELTPQEKHNNMRHTLHMIQEGVSNAIRELLPIRDILKKGFSKHELESDEESSDESSVEVDYSDEDRKKSRRRRHDSTSTESESESENESESEEEHSEPEEEKKEDDDEEEEGSIFHGIVNSISNVFGGKREEEKQEVEVEESKPVEIPSHIPSHVVIEDESDIQEFTEQSEKEPIMLSFDEEEKTMIQEPIQIGSSQETESVMQAFIQEKLAEEENHVEEEEIKQIVLDGTRIPKEYRSAPNPSPEKEDVEVPIISRVEEPITQRILDEEFSSSVPIEDDRISSISSGFVYKHPEPPKAIRRQDSFGNGNKESVHDEIQRSREEDYYTLEKLRRKERERQEKEKEKIRQRMLKKQQLQMSHRNDLYQKNLAIYKQHHKSSESDSMISGISSIASSQVSRKERTKPIDSFLQEQQRAHVIPEGNKMISRGEVQEPISYVQRPSMKIQPQPSIASIVRKQTKDEDSGDEYKSDRELSNA